MVVRQLRNRGIADRRVLAAMGEVQRELFLPPSARAEAYHDGAVGIGEGQTMSQPWIVACMTTLLELGGQERVLEVGTGSGYGAAVLSRCCAAVVTIERHSTLARRAATVLDVLGYDNVRVLRGDGCEGAPAHAPFDAVVVTAAASEQPPRALFDQLRPAAPLVCPVRRADGEHLMRFRGSAEEAVVPVRFVPLVSGAPDR